MAEAGIIEEFRNVKIEFEPLNGAPNSTDRPLILMLNDDCLIEIFSYLREPYWISLEKTHARFKELLCQYIYPKMDIHLGWFYKCDDDLRCIGAHAKSVIMAVPDIERLRWFRKLEVLNVTAYRLFARELKSVPAGIKVLSLSVKLYSAGTSCPRKLFRKLNPTLTTLHLQCKWLNFDLSSLKELDKIRDVVLPVHEDLIGINNFLMKNRNHLESLQLVFFHEYSHHFKYELNEQSLRLCALPKLKVLRIRGRSFINIVLPAPAAYPCLEEIEVTILFFKKQKIEAFIGSIISFNQLKKICLRGFGKEILILVYQMPNLLNLEMEMGEKDLLEATAELPRLQKMNPHINCRLSKAKN